MHTVGAGPAAPPATAVLASREPTRRPAAAVAIVVAIWLGTGHPGAETLLDATVAAMNWNCC